MAEEFMQKWQPQGRKKDGYDRNISDCDHGPIVKARERWKGREEQSTYKKHCIYSTFSTDLYEKSKISESMRIFY